MKKICIISGCENKHYGLGYCNSHYNNFKQRGDPLKFSNVEETRKKLSESAKKRIKRDGFFIYKGMQRKGEPSPQKGKKLSEEHKRKISKSKTGITPNFSDEDKKRRKKRWTAENNPSFGGLSEQHKSKLSKTRKKLFAEGKLQSPMKNKKHTDSAKKKNADAHRHPLLPETIEKLRKFRNTPKGKEIARKAWEASRKAHAKPNKPEKRIGEILSTHGIKVTSKPRIDEKLLKPNEAKFHQMVRYKTLDNKYDSKEIDIVWKDSMGNKKIIEYNGYAGRHCDPRDGFKPDDIQEVHNKPKRVQDIWNEEKMVLDQIKKEGYDVLVVWEYDFLNNFENEKKRILKFANSETLS